VKRLINQIIIIRKTIKVKKSGKEKIKKIRRIRRALKLQLKTLRVLNSRKSELKEKLKKKSFQLCLKQSSLRINLKVLKDYLHNTLDLKIYSK
jgi:hypothetical protein